MKKVTLTNSFHQTSVVVHVDPKVASLPQSEIYLWLRHHASGRGAQPEKQKLKRVEKALCGINSCRCRIVDNK